MILEYTCFNNCTIFAKDSNEKLNISLSSRDEKERVLKLSEKVEQVRDTKMKSLEDA